MIKIKKAKNRIDNKIYTLKQLQIYRTGDKRLRDLECLIPFCHCGLSFYHASKKKEGYVRRKPNNQHSWFCPYNPYFKTIIPLILFFIFISVIIFS